MLSSITTTEENLAAADNIGITTEKIMVITGKAPEMIATVATEDNTGITAENVEVTTQEAPEITTTEGPMIFVLDMDIDIDDIVNTTEKVIVTTEEVPEITTNEATSDDIGIVTEKLMVNNEEAPEMTTDEKEATTTEKSPEIEFTTTDTSTKLRTEIRQPKQLETAGIFTQYTYIDSNHISIYKNIYIYISFVI